jgi:hypothetical protein
MKYRSPVILLVIFSIFTFTLCEVRFIFEMFRHGARSPWTGLDKDGKDILGESWVGSGELSDVGMRQHYLLGHRNRLKYGNFISQSYDPNEIYVVSTNYNRTIMSAYSQLQGLYQPGSGPILNDGQIKVGVPPLAVSDLSDEQKKLGSSALPDQIQVLPIRLFDPNTKRFQLHDVDKCPPVGPIVEENRKKEGLKVLYQQFNLSHGEALSKALNITDPDYFFKYENVYSLCDTFISDYFDGRPLKKLTDAGLDLVKFNQTATEFLNYDIMELNFGDKDYFIGRMSMSPTVLDIVQWMDNRIDNDIHGIGFLGYKSPKIVMYSAHDTTLGAIQAYLKAVFNQTDFFYTPFASSIYFELNRKDNFTDFKKLTLNDYSVTVTYNDIQLLEMPYTTFKELVKKKSLSDAEIAQFCGFIPQPQENGTDPFMISTIVLGIVSVGLLSYVGYILYKGKKEEATGYNNIGF